MSRTLKIVHALEAESLEDSFANLDRVDDFYYPGFSSQSLGGNPFDDIQILLSNRRVVKILAELPAEPRETRLRLVNRFLDRYLQQYSAIFRSLEKANSHNLALGAGDAFRISDDEKMPRTLSGTRHALRAIVLAAAMTGDAELLKRIRDVFRHPLVGAAIDPRDFDPGLLVKLNRMPLFPLGVRAQVAFQWMNAAGARAAEGGVDLEKVRGVLRDDYVSELSVPNFQAKVTQYDILLRAGARIDRSFGEQTYKMLTTADGKALQNFLQAMAITEITAVH